MHPVKRRIVKDFTQTELNRLTQFIFSFGSVDGAHHKQWCIDQILRELLEDEYDRAVRKFENNGKYEWDTGIAP